MTDKSKVDPRTIEESDYYYYFKFKKDEHNFKKLWNMKSSARIALKEWLIAIPFDEEPANIIANSCSELIENSIKYSISNTYSRVEIYAIQNSIFVETQNTAEEKDIKVLKEYLEVFKEEGIDLAELYINKIRESEEKGASQLGLIKILLETRGKLEIVDMGKRDSVHLRLRLFL